MNLFPDLNLRLCGFLELNQFDGGNGSNLNLNYMCVVCVSLLFMFSRVL